VPYWLTALALIVFGLLAIFSFGWILFVVALAMVVLGPVRRRPEIFWPPMTAVIAFLVGYLAVAPLSCFASAEPPGVVSPVVCTSALGVEYRGEGSFAPSSLPGVEAGLVLALVANIVVGAVLWWRRSHRAGVRT